MKSAHCPNRTAGFTLVEMLAVMTIIAILMVTGTMVTNSVLRSTQLSTETTNLADQLARASLDSVRLNKPVAFRFYRYKDPFVAETPLVRAYQVLTLDAATGRYEQLDRIRYLRYGIAILDLPGTSTILSLPERQPVSGSGTGRGTGSGSDTITDPELPMIAPYSYYQFEFRPDGSTNLPKDQAWGIVIADYDEGAAYEVPANYRALDINPFTGAVKRY